MNKGIHTLIILQPKEPIALIAGRLFRISDSDSTQLSRTVAPVLDNPPAIASKIRCTSQPDVFSYQIKTDRKAYE